MAILSVVSQAVYRPGNTGLAATPRLVMMLADMDQHLGNVGGFPNTAFLLFEGAFSNSSLD